MRYGHLELQRFCTDVLCTVGMEKAEARVVADSLVRANLEGNDSHGIGRLPIYARRLAEGRINAAPQIAYEYAGAVLKVDGDNGPGQLVSHRGLEAALPLAREHGLAGLAIRNSNHFGTAAYYAQRACAQGFAMIATTNSPPGIAPWGGKTAYFGTNPIAFGFPRREEPHVVMDMSSSVVARGNVIMAEREGRDIPEGWAIDEEGRPTTEAASALQGTMLPLGGLEGGAKGYALAMAVEILSGVLSGAAFGPHVNNLYQDGDPPANVGHCFILIDVARWLEPGEYYQRMDQLLNEIRQVPLAGGYKEILYPGERRSRALATNSERGVDLPGAVDKDLESLGGKHEVEPPCPAA